MFDTVRFGNKLIPFNEFRQMYNYISVVYLEDGCQPCYPKFIEWQNRIDSLNYLLNNNDIPRWIIDGSVLIGPDNKIKMIGEPWATHEMTELFYSICQ